MQLIVIRRLVWSKWVGQSVGILLFKIIDDFWVERLRNNLRISSNSLSFLEFNLICECTRLIKPSVNIFIASNELFRDLPIWVSHLESLAHSLARSYHLWILPSTLPQSLAGLGRRILIIQLALG